MKKVCTLFCVCLLVIFTSFAFAEENKERPPINAPGIVLTFDDTGNLESWAKRIPLFKKYGAKATFVLHQPDKITERQKQLMKDLAEIGCEMGCHGFRHRRGNEWVEQKGLQAYLDEEIVPAVQTLEKLGYPQHSFAYPESRRTAETDEALKKYFRHIRTGGGVCDHPIDKNNNIFIPITKVCDQFLIYGARFDKTTPAGVHQFVVPGLKRIKEKGEIVLLYGHGIVPTGAKTYETNEDGLEELFKQVNELGLKFYTMDEL